MIAVEDMFHCCCVTISKDVFDIKVVLIGYKFLGLDVDNTIYSIVMFLTVVEHVVEEAVHVNAVDTWIYIIYHGESSILHIGKNVAQTFIIIFAAQRLMFNHCFWRKHDICVESLLLYLHLTIAFIL